MVTKLMLDVAHYDGRQTLTTNPYTYAYHPIDWVRASPKWPAVIIKQGQGNSHDPLFKAQFQAALGRSARGVYHFYMTGANAIATANLCADDIEAAGGYGELGVWLDVETNPSQLPGSTYLAGVGSWLNEMHKRMILANAGSRPLGIYTRKSFFDPLWVQAGSPSWTKAYPAWLAAYPMDYYVTIDPARFNAWYNPIFHDGIYPTNTPSSVAFTNLAAWQLTAKGKPSDVLGYPPYKLSIDFNLLYLDIAPETTPPPEPSDAEKLDRLWDAHPELH